MAKKQIKNIQLLNESDPGYDDYDKLENERKLALSVGDSVSYVNLCNGLGVEPEDRSLYEGGLAEILVEDQGLGSFVGETKKRKTRSSKYRQNYKELYEVSIELRVNPDRIFDDIDSKKSLLVAYMGYTKLNGVGGDKILIDDASDSRVGNVFKDCFYRGRDAFTQDK